MSILCILGFAIPIPFLRETQTWGKIVTKSMDLITMEEQPSFPACLGLGISYSISRLKK